MLMFGRHSLAQYRLSLKIVTERVVSMSGVGSIDERGRRWSMWTAL